MVITPEPQRLFEPAAGATGLLIVAVTAVLDEEVQPVALFLV